MIEELLDLVVDFLSGLEFDRPITVAKEYAPTLRVTEVTELTLLVSPGEVSSERMSRQLHKMATKIEIYLGEKLPSGDKAIDGQIAIRSELLSRLRSWRSGLEITIDEGLPYDPEGLRRGLYISRIDLNYETIQKEESVS